MAAQPGERLTVGLVRGLQGLRGTVRVEVLSDDPDRFAVGAVLHVEGEQQPLTLAWVQRDGPGLLMRFEERTTRESVEQLRGCYLEAEGAQPLPEGHYYWHELVGVPVASLEGDSLGRVTDVFRAGGGEVLVVDGGAHGEIMVPTVSAVVADFAPREGRIVVDASALDLGGTPVEPRPRGRRTTRALRPVRPSPVAPGDDGTRAKAEDEARG